VVLEIRRVQSQDEYWGVENIQREAWGFPDIGIVPDNMLMAVQHNGGLVLGAFERPSDDQPERMIGFALGFLGCEDDGPLRHWSHMVAVLPEFQSRNVGYRLKLAQRDHVLSQSIEHVLWTFDPLESRNAYLNFHKLGAVCATYRRDVYGRMRDDLNISLPSDRFEVDWHVASHHVAERLDRSDNSSDLPEMLGAGVPVLNDAAGGFRLPADPVDWSSAGRCVMIQIPARFQELKAGNLELARAWRHQTRGLFEEAFALGYVVVDLLHEDGRSFYVLRKDWHPDED
jgi:predicted GNAT superfamily acetyltransferase